MSLSEDIDASPEKANYVKQRDNASLACAIYECYNITEFVYRAKKVFDCCFGSEQFWFYKNL
jgi:hypothetical protein